VPADLDQFGRDNSHGTVVGWKSFVQLGHQTADGRGLFNQMNQVAGVGQIQRRLHSGDSAAENQHRSIDFFRHVAMLLSIGFISLSLETREGANLFVLVKFVNLKYAEFAKSRIPPIYGLAAGEGPV
jgi:hypothetical protein